jgi:hypothetical protein
MIERPAIVRIHEFDSDDQAHVSIVLEWHDEEFIGEATGPVEWSARPRLVGEATLRAVEKVTNNAVSLSLAAVATTDLGSAQIAVAQVRLEGTNEALVGSAMLGETDQSAATVKAVLDALNRRISRDA